MTDNTTRGCALYFGPDATQTFLQQHGLSLVIRSHEGPDARSKRPDLEQDMMDGYAVDQLDAQGHHLLVTLFSAPDYPQGSCSRGNRGAWLRLNLDCPQLSYEVGYFSSDATNRPPIPPYFDQGLNPLLDLE
jgi:serine/threonine-protein phosphatase 5